MKRLMCVFFLFNIGISFAADYSKIDKQSETVPSNLRTPKEIARYLTKNLTSPFDKSRAIFYWIAHNIRYDVEKLNTNYTYNDSQELVDEVLLHRKGVCSNYSALFKALCQSVGIESYIVDGYIRQNGKLMLIGHSWNAVKIDHHFYNVDATWAAGYLEKGKFIQHFRDADFMILPAEFIKTHIPFDPIWQFSTNPISFKDFDSNNFENRDKSLYFDFIDSIKIIATLNPLEELKREKMRIIHCGISNKLVNQVIIYLTSNIESEELGIEAIKFNRAVRLFNEGVLVFNKCISTLNNSTLSSTKPNHRLMESLNLSRQKTQGASILISKIQTKDSKLNSEIYVFKKSIENQLISIEKQINLINK